jgi:hypothetical protein
MNELLLILKEIKTQYGVNIFHPGNEYKLVRVVVKRNFFRQGKFYGNLDVFLLY